MKSIGCVVLILLLLVSTKGYQRIKSYGEYTRRWKQQVQKEFVHDVTHLAKHNQQCDGFKCPFFYYQYKSEHQNQNEENATVLLVGGMHGNQYLGPHTLLYGYKYFKARHIVYFPVANPSGFQLNQRMTHPTRKDPNRDFPVDGNYDCYNTNAALILDHLFRTYSFDLTIILHDGSSDIGFNWGTYRHQSNSRTVDYEIQKGIAEMMKKVGGSNQELGMSAFKVGTMSDVIYPATGSLDDWAYAVGRYPQIVTSCKNYNFEKYPQGMAKGLVFLIEMGPQSSTLLGYESAVHSKGEKRRDDGYVSRGIRMVKAGLETVNPTLEVQWSEQYALVSVRGCTGATLKDLSILQFPALKNIQEEVHSIFDLKQSIELQGNAREENQKQTKIDFNQKIRDPKQMTMVMIGQIECSKSWVGKGSTYFSRSHSYKVREVRYGWQLPKIQSPVMKEEVQEKGFIQKWLGQYTFEDWVVFIVVVIVILVLMSAIFAILQCLLKPKEKRQQKFQQTETDLDQHDLHTARGGIIYQDM